MKEIRQWRLSGTSIEKAFVTTPSQHKLALQLADYNSLTSLSQYSQASAACTCYAGQCQYPSTVRHGSSTPSSEHTFIMIFALYTYTIRLVECLPMKTRLSFLSFSSFISTHRQMPDYCDFVPEDRLPLNTCHSVVVSFVYFYRSSYFQGSNGSNLPDDTARLGPYVNILETSHSRNFSD